MKVRMPTLAFSSYLQMLECRFMTIQVIIDITMTFVYIFYFSDMTIFMKMVSGKLLMRTFDFIPPSTNT